MAINYMNWDNDAMRWVYLFLIVCFVSCNPEGKGRQGAFRIGIDPSWNPLNFQEMQPYVNGYMEDVLLEMARYNGTSFEKMSASFSDLLEGLDRGRFDAIVTSLPPFEFNTAKYDFSPNILNTGLVLVVSEKSSYKRLGEMSGKLVAIITGSPAALVVEKTEGIILRTYPSLSEALDAIVDGEVEAAVLDRLPTAPYVRNLYDGQLRVVGAPLTPDGLRIITKKDEGSWLRPFDQSIQHMQKKHVLESLEKKWQLQ